MKSIGYVVLSIGLASAAFAAEPMSDGVRRCASTADSLARLVCYDRLYGVLPAGSAAARAPAASTVSPAAPAAAAAVTAGAAVAATPAPSFGEDALKKSKADKVAEDAKAPHTLTAKISALLDTQGNMYRVTLDNGQVWQTQEGRSMFVLKVGDTVRLDRGTMGGYRMSRVVNGKDTLAVRAVRKE